MMLSLLAPFGIIGIAAGLFGLYLARMLRVDGSAEDAAETSHNARLILVASSTLLLISLVWTG